MLTATLFPPPRPSQHGSTWGGNPVACAVATASLQVVVDEKLGENAASVGAHLTRALQALVPSSGGALASVRGQGLLVGVVMGPPAPGRPSAWQLCERLIARSAVLAKPTGLHGDVVRFAPPLAMTVAEADRCVAAVKDAVASFA